MTERLVEAEGQVHLIAVCSGGEHTLCGDAFDLGSHLPSYEWRATRKRTVTCPRCAAEIANCRGVRIATPDNKDKPNA